MKSKTIKTFIFAILLSMATGCATVVPPSGGPKDTTPPVPVAYNPPNKSLNYSGGKIAIRFDEFIQLKDLHSQLVVSPAMPHDPDVYVQGKKLIINPPDSLAENTTYTVYLGNSVVNYKEGLPVKHFQYVFSTGSALDSLRISGVVKNAFDLKTEEGILVMLYKEPSDSLPYLKRPYYIAKTYSGGDFVLDNLSEGKYLIFALKDMNSNYLYDQPSEKIAFLDSLVIPSPIKPDDDSLNLIHPVFLNMYLFQEKAKKQAVTRKAVLRKNLLEIDFKRPVKKLQIKPLNFNNSGQWYYPVMSSGKDSLKMWLTSPVPDTLVIKVSDGGQTIDTLSIILKKPDRKKYTGEKRKNQAIGSAKPVKKRPVRLSIKSNTSRPVDFFGNPFLVFSTPVKAIDRGKINVYKKIDTLYKDVPFKVFFKDTVAANRLYFDIKMDENSVYKIFIPDSVFFDIFGNTNDTLKFDFSTTKSRNYGSLTLNIKYGDSIPLLIQLLNEKDAVIRQNVLKDSLLYYKYLPPGKYKVKAVKDINGNKKWDTGDYLKGIQPERVFYMPKALTIRANWDVENKWIPE